MNKLDVIHILRRHYNTINEGIDALDFVEDLFTELRTDAEENTPYAMNFIRSMTDAISEIRMLQSVLDE